MSAPKSAASKAAAAAAKGNKGNKAKIAKIANRAAVVSQAASAAAASNAGNASNASNAGNASTPYPARPPSSLARLPVSGAEDVYTYGLFASPKGKGNNNCYAWAIDAYRDSGSRKLQPGNESALGGQLDLSSCAALRARALADLKKNGYVVDADQACRRGFYKIMGFLDPGTDHHWYKQHRHALIKLTDKLRTPADVARALGVAPSQVYAATPAPKPGDVVLVRDAKLWSHKQGFATGPLLRDACGRAIADPRKACRSYGALDYTAYCGAVCVKSRRAKHVQQNATT